MTKITKILILISLGFSVVAGSLLFNNKNQDVVNNEINIPQITQEAQITTTINKENNIIKQKPIYNMINKNINIEKRYENIEYVKSLNVKSPENKNETSLIESSMAGIINNPFISEDNEHMLTLFSITNQERFEIAVNKIDDNLSTYDWFLEYKKIYDEYSIYEDVELPRTIYDDFTKEEIEIMFRCVETEVFQADFDSKVNVASVIFNRLKHNRFPNDVITVITTPRQFAYFRTEIEESSKLALEYAYIFGDTTGGCISFRSDIAPETWYGWKYQFTDKEGHNFYIDDNSPLLQ